MSPVLHVPHGRRRQGTDPRMPLCRRRGLWHIVSVDILLAGRSPVLSWLATDAALLGCFLVQ